MTPWLLRLAAALSLVTASSCATLQQMAALRQVDFALDGVRNASLAGVPLERGMSYRDLSVVEVGQLTLALTRGEVPLELDVVVLARNPESNTTSATLTQMAWTLFLDETETISGTLDRRYTLPPGEPTSIPVRASLNLVEFFDRSGESLVNLATALTGGDADATQIALRVVPTIDTPLGPMTYPSPITVVNRTVGGPAQAGRSGPDP